jgi:hypothetical protein
MSTTVEEVLALADVEKCLKETGAESTHGHCHNACVWLIVKIKEANLSDYNIAWCLGTFWNKDHSWLIVQDLNDGEDIIVDMTVNQFVDREVPFSGPMNDQYEIRDSVSLCETEKLHEFVERVG